MSAAEQSAPDSAGRELRLHEFSLARGLSPYCRSAVRSSTSRWGTCLGYGVTIMLAHHLACHLLGGGSVDLPDLSKNSAATLSGSALMARQDSNLHNPLRFQGGVEPRTVYALLAKGKKANIFSVYTDHKGRPVRETVNVAIHAPTVIACP